jgi:BON domain
MKSDKLIQQDVENELRWCPEIDATDIAIHVRDGVVTLTGYARNYYEKFQAVGVAAVAEDLLEQLPIVLLESGLSRNTRAGECERCRHAVTDERCSHRLFS